MARKYSKETLEKAVQESVSFRSLMSHLGISITGSSHTWLKKRVIEYGIDFSHFGTMKNGKSKGRKSADDILVVIPDNIFSREARKMLIRAMHEKGIEYKCHMDGCENPNPTWRGEVLNLDIDHIDGNWRNCTLENLRFLCPNCHSQTPSNSRSRSSVDGKPVGGHKKRSVPCPKCSNQMYYKSMICNACRQNRSRNLLPKSEVKTNYPPLKELVKRLSENSYLAVAKEIGVSDNAVRKHLKRNGYDPKTLQKI